MNFNGREKNLRAHPSLSPKPKHIFQIFLSLSLFTFRFSHSLSPARFGSIGLCSIGAEHLSPTISQVLPLCFIWFFLWIRKKLNVFVFGYSSIWSTVTKTIIPWKVSIVQKMFGQLIQWSLEIILIHCFLLKLHFESKGTESI